MGAAPATLEQLARDTVSIADPEVALRALGALRQELERLEPELVQRAIAAGASWSQIARALGISKQAAHRRHRHLTESGFDAITGQHRVAVTPDARRTIQLARDEARRIGLTSLGTEHILLGILCSEGSAAMTVLAALGVTHAAAADRLQTTLPGVPAPQPGEGQEPPEVRVSPQARRIIQGSLREAVKRGDDHIGVEHLLLALLADSRNGAVQTLEALGVTSREVRRRLDQELSAATSAAHGPV